MSLNYAYQFSKPRLPCISFESKKMTTLHRKKNFNLCRRLMWKKNFSIFECSTEDLYWMPLQSNFF